MNALATVIASYGLLGNSAAVVIGAMVVAMLLGPIAGVALGLNEGNRPLLWTALLSLTGGIVWILAIGTAIGFIHRDVPLTGEILSRTNPKLFDLMIALSAGAAGAVAVVSPRIGSAIVGVAVAAALVPPLAASGLLLARGDLALSASAMLLALTNVVAIEVAFSAVFWVGGFRRLAAIGADGLLLFLRRNLLALMMLAGLAAVLGMQLRHTISAALFRSQAMQVLRDHPSPAAGYHVVDLRFTRQAGATIVRAVVRGPDSPTAEEVGIIQSAPPRPLDGSSIQLRVRFIKIEIMTPQWRAIFDDATDGND